MRSLISVSVFLLAILALSPNTYAQTNPICIVDGNYFLHVDRFQNDIRSISGDLDTINNGREHVDWWVSASASPGRYFVTGNIGIEIINLELILDQQNPHIMRLQGRLGQQQWIDWEGYNDYFTGFQFCH